MFPVSILYFLACPGVPGNVPSMFPYFDFELSWYVPGIDYLCSRYVPGMARYDVPGMFPVPFSTRRCILSWLRPMALY